MLDLDQFVADCRDALAADKSHKLVREVVRGALADPSAVLKALGEPTRGAIKAIYRSDELTILNVIWAPYMTLMPHNHNMWAVIGICTGGFKLGVTARCKGSWFARRRAFGT